MEICKLDPEVAIVVTIHHSVLFKDMSFEFKTFLINFLHYFIVKRRWEEL